MVNVLNRIEKHLTPHRVKILFWGYAALLILIAILPINSAGASINHTFIVSIRLDYLLHFAIFLPWMFLMRRYSGLSFKTDFWKTLAWIFAGIIFAMFTESLQYGLSYRAFNINDLLANGIGVLLGSTMFIK